MRRPEVICLLWDSFSFLRQTLSSWTQNSSIKLKLLVKEPGTACLPHQCEDCKHTPLCLAFLHGTKFLPGWPGLCSRRISTAQSWAFFTHTKGFPGQYWEAVFMRFCLRSPVGFYFGLVWFGFLVLQDRVSPSALAVLKQAL